VPSLSDAIAAGDLDALIRLVDGFCSSRDWDLVVELRDRARHAHEQRGLQLWPAAEYAEYRLALDAPGAFAGPVVDTEAGRFALGPLWEVAASSHPWSELRDHLPIGPARTLCAHDRVLRGEDLSGDDTIDAAVLELPLRVQPWEPVYPTATYRSSEADFPAPESPPLEDTELSGGATTIDDDESIEALLDIGAVWARQSNGLARAGAVEGSALDAIAALGHGACRAARIEPQSALATIAWAGASGGAYGRRRGAAMGRFIAWWLVATLSDLEWPAEANAIATAAADLTWFAWEPPDLQPGWSASIAIQSDTDGLAWALETSDSYREDDELATS
jgi:hypothetical protein